MSILEKRIIVFAILFVGVYLGAIVLTLQSRSRIPQQETRIESAVPVPKEEARLMLAELLAPMAVLFVLSVCFILAKRKRMQKYRRLDDTDKEFE